MHWCMLAHVCNTINQFTFNEVKLNCWRGVGFDSLHPRGRQSRIHNCSLLGSSLSAVDRWTNCNRRISIYDLLGHPDNFVHVLRVSPDNCSGDWERFQRFIADRFSLSLNSLFDRATYCNSHKRLNGPRNFCHDEERPCKLRRCLRNDNAM